MKKQKKTPKCPKCGTPMKRIKTSLMGRTEISNPEDPYDGGYTPIQLHLPTKCNCYKNK